MLYFSTRWDEQSTPCHSYSIPRQEPQNPLSKRMVRPQGTGLDLCGENPLPLPGGLNLRLSKSLQLKITTKNEVLTTSLKYRFFIKEFYDWRHPLKKTWLGKKNKMFYFTRKTQEFHVGCTATRHAAIFLCP